MDKESAIEILECIKDDFSDMMPECLKAINYAIETLKNLSELEILENATNGDIIKAMFPDAIKSNYIESDLNMIDYVTIYLGDYEMRVSYDWWDSPYNKEVDDEQ